MTTNVLSFEQEFTRVKSGHVHLLRLLREAIGTKEVQWSDLTKLNLSKIKAYLSARFSPNSVCTYLSVLKAFLAHYEDEGIIPCNNPNKELRGKHVPSQHIALTEDELLRFEQYEPKTETERDVKILFMRACLTGARSSDAKQFTTDNVQGKHISYVSQKTKTEVSQPVHKLLKRYLEQQPSKTHARKVVNKTIQRICQDLGMDEEVQLFVSGKLQKGRKYEFITMHTARRTFCSCLAMRNVPVPLISRLAGHSTPAMTERYICIDTKQLTDGAMSFYKG